MATINHDVERVKQLHVTRALLLKKVELTTTFDQLNTIGAAAGTVAFDRSVKVAKVALAAVDTGGGVFAWQSPEAGTVLVNRVLLDVTTKATGACTLAVGTTATNATTSSNNLLDALDVGTAAGVFDNLKNGGTAGKAGQELAAGKWVTASKASGATAGMVGSAYIFYTLI